MRDEPEDDYGDEPEHEEEEFEDIQDAFEEVANEDEETHAEPENDEETDESEAEEEPEFVEGVEESAAVRDVEADDVESTEKRRITGGEFECEMALGRDATARFLRDLAHQIESGNELTVGTETWELPFEFAEPIEVEIEHEGPEDDEPRELEIEIEFDWRDEETLEVR